MKTLKYLSTMLACPLLLFLYFRFGQNWAFYLFEASLIFSFVFIAVCCALVFNPAIRKTIRTDGAREKIKASHPNKFKLTFSTFVTVGMVIALFINGHWILVSLQVLLFVMARVLFHAIRRIVL